MCVGVCDFKNGIRGKREWKNMNSDISAAISILYLLHTGDDVIGKYLMEFDFRYIALGNQRMHSLHANGNERG